MCVLHVCACVLWGAGGSVYVHAHVCVRVFRQTDTHTYMCLSHLIHPHEAPVDPVLHPPQPPPLQRQERPLGGDGALVPRRNEAEEGGLVVVVVVVVVVGVFYFSWGGRGGRFFCYFLKVFDFFE